VVQRYLDGSETRRRTRLGNLRELPPTIEQSLRPRLQRLPLLANAARLKKMLGKASTPVGNEPAKKTARMMNLNRP
jgi:hypothetical protein